MPKANTEKKEPEKKETKRMLGWGLAEKAKKEVDTRKSKVDKAVRDAGG